MGAKKLVHFPIKKAEVIPEKPLPSAAIGLNQKNMINLYRELFAKLSKRIKR